MMMMVMMMMMNDDDVKVKVKQVVSEVMINTITITVEHSAPALQRGEPYAKQNGDFTGSCPGCHRCLEDLQDLATICRCGQSPSSSPQ